MSGGSKTEIACDLCGTLVLRFNSSVNRNRKLGRGTYCSRLCINRATKTTEASKTIRDLASRPCGTNSREVSQETGKTLQGAADALCHLASKKEVIRVRGRQTPEGRVCHQYFGITEHALAWEKSHPLKRVNIKITKPPRQKFHVQSVTWARAPMIGDVSAKKTIVRSQGHALGYDTRYELGPEASANFRGEFSKLGPGRYL